MTRAQKDASAYYPALVVDSHRFAKFPTGVRRYGIVQIAEFEIIPNDCV
jgi:hypothetical protein